MTDLLQLVTAGLSAGVIYALLAIGFVGIFSVSQVINLAQGEFAALAGLISASAVTAGVPAYAAVAAAVLTGGIVALCMERLTIAPIRHLTTLTSIIISLGVSITLKATMLLAWGPVSLRLPPFTEGNFHIAGVSIRAQEFWIVGIGALVAITVGWFYERTLIGKALHACAEQPTAARLVGISPKRATAFAFVVAGTVAAIAGVLASPIYLSSWSSGLTLGLKGFVAAALGGLLSIRGAVQGGLLLGILESLVAGYLDTGLKDAAAFLVLLVLLVVRPAGIFGRHAIAAA